MTYNFIVFRALLRTWDLDLLQEVVIIRNEYVMNYRIKVNFFTGLHRYVFNVFEQPGGIIKFDEPELSSIVNG